MSQIFYSEVDQNLRLELQERGTAGRFKRSDKYIRYMTEKIANVLIRAYKQPEEGDTSIPSLPATYFPELGGFNTKIGRYLPSGPNGFLNSQQTTYERKWVEVTTDESGNSTAGFATENLTDNSRRIGPYLRTVDVSIGDGSMGLLNKATFALTIPNPTRDLDGIEDTWMHPGRYVTIELQHPESAVITDGILTTPENLNDARLKELYPDLDPSEKRDELLKMNRYSFSGLITSFDLSYNADASVDITIQLTGTSEIYTDLSLFMEPEQQKKNNKKKPVDGNVPPNLEFSSELSKAIQSEIVSYNNSLGSQPTTKTGLIPFTYYDTSIDPTDKFILYGQPYSETISRIFSPDPREIKPYTASNAWKDDNKPAATDSDYNPLGVFDLRLLQSAILKFMSGSDSDYTQWNDRQIELTVKDIAAQKAQFGREQAYLTGSLTSYNEYITLGGLIHFLNKNIISKQAGTSTIFCDDAQCFSPWYENLKSIDPNNVLLLPKDPSDTDDSDHMKMNWYGDNAWFQDVVSKTVQSEGRAQWPGVSISNKGGTGKIFSSRIFINKTSINKIVESLSEKNKIDFTVKTFLGKISVLIKTATAGAINMQLTTNKFLNNNITDTNGNVVPNETMIFTDAHYIKDPDTVPVIPFSIPMFANHIYGTIVRDFQFTAKLPSSVKNLSYVLNQPDVSSEQIAPYMNFMFNANDPKKVQKAINLYKQKYNTNIDILKLKAIQFGLTPQDKDSITEFKKAMLTYIQTPTDDIQRSQQITSPIFPFDASFTIDGINGFRYGDVLQFDALPKKYTANTVFSIIGINHTVSNDGEWKTKINCIMRPSLE
tara:strand:+ start:409 stop:2892 length:2484 start_codon:yes stop_codon:yes gene_type:complete